MVRNSRKLNLMKKKSGKSLASTADTQDSETDPQKNLERILQAEIDIADQISQAKDKSEKLITLASDEISRNMEESIQKARIKIEKKFKSDITFAGKEAERIKTDARKDAEVFMQKGNEHIKNAAKFIIALILEEDVNREAK